MTSQQSETLRVRYKSGGYATTMTQNRKDLLHEMKRENQQREAVTPSMMDGNRLASIGHA